MSQCENCVICGNFIGKGNDPAVCNGCWPEYEVETDFNKMDSSIPTLCNCEVCQSVRLKKDSSTAV